jgi:branched-chain amino acid transport system permease protein
MSLMLDMILSQAVNGLVLGFLYVLIAIGLSIIFGMLGIVNFAHGSFFALGAYIAYVLNRDFGWGRRCWRRFWYGRGRDGGRNGC